MRATFGELAPYLFDFGFAPAPIMPRTKAPNLPGWQTPRDPGDWPTKCATWGVGILTATTPALDLDIRDKHLVRALIELVEDMTGGGPVRIGQWPKALMPCSTDTPFEKVTSFWFALPGEDWTVAEYKPHRVEVLGEGQQFVAYAIHPGTGRPYRWCRGEPMQMHAVDLPYLEERTARELIATIEAVVLEVGAVRLERIGRNWRPWRPPEPRPARVGHTIAPGERIDWSTVDLGTLARRLDPKGARRSRDGSWRCRCPVHQGDSHNSLTLSPGDEAPVIWHCHADCHPDAVRNALARELR